MSASRTSAAAGSARCGHGPPTLTVESAGFATVQDLGRPGHAVTGVSLNGASDRWSAQVANTLVGNPPGAPLLEVTGSALTVVSNADLLVCVTGAEVVPSSGLREVPTWEPFVMTSGTPLVIPAPARGLRSYLAVSGGIAADRVLGSVAPDPMLGVGGHLGHGDRLEVGGCVCGWQHPYYAPPLFRLGAPRPTWARPTLVDVTAGPELEEFETTELDGPWTVSMDSDYVGLRAEGPTPARAGDSEIRSRGVPVGAVEVPPSGGLLILLYGRLLTAGYPVPYVATSAALDALGQARPGDELMLHEIALADAVARGRARRDELAALAHRTATALRTSGLGDRVLPGHLGDA